MPEKDPTTYTMLTYTWIVALAAWGGIVNFINKVRKGEARACNIAEFIGEIVTSGFAGILTFWLSEAAGLQPLVTAALVGISGHLGSRAIFLMERWATGKFMRNVDHQ